MNSFRIEIAGLRRRINQILSIEESDIPGCNVGLRLREGELHIVDAVSIRKSDS
jgi:hypothetical protein